MSYTVPNVTNVLPEPEGLEKENFDFGSFPIDSLMIRTENRSIFEICRRIKSGQFELNPDFQREFIWDSLRQSKLIESALLRVPLPVFYLAETRSGKVVVVDGLQRLTTFYRFLNNEFALSGLEFASELNGKRFVDLPAILKNRIEDLPLTLYLIDSSVPEEAMYEIFERVNGGVPLTRQQMRNCLFVGDATRWLAKMAKHEAFLHATGYSLSWQTMRDRECINRFAGFYLYGEVHYSGKMETFLNETLRKMNVEPPQYDRLTSAFLQSMHNNLNLFGEHAFRKSMMNLDNSRSVINIALFDVFSVIMADVTPETIARNKEQILAAATGLFGREDFISSISGSTNSTRNVLQRFQLVRDMLKPIII
jgi:hypothetical protein